MSSTFWCVNWALEGSESSQHGSHRGDGSGRLLFFTASRCGLSVCPDVVFDCNPAANGPIYHHHQSELVGDVAVHVSVRQAVLF